MNRWLALLLSVTLLFLATGMAQAQSLEEKLQKFESDYAKGYVGPLGETFGAALNSGWYHSASLGTGLDIFIGVKIMGMPIPDDSKTFTAYSPYDNNAQVVPTVAGDNNEVAISGHPNGAEPSAYLKGYNVPFAPMILPQISAGNLFGTRVILRFLPPVNFDLGSISLFGVGVQHSISQWFPAIPLDVAANFGYQRFSMGDLIDAHGVTFGVEASKSFAVLTVYGGLAYETSTFSFSYTATYTDPANPSQTKSNPVAFDIDGKNTVRGTLGLALSLGVFKMSADYSFAAQSVVVLGLGVGF